MSSESSWSDLPNDILVLIFDIAKDPIDIVRCGAACKSWLPTALQVFRKFLGFCFILTGKDEDNTRVMFNLLTKETRKIHLPEANENWISSCKNSWLFMVDSILPHRMQLLNVLSRTRIYLPPLPRMALKKCSLKSPFNWRLLLLKCPLNSDCILFLVRCPFKGLHTISSSKPGRRKWTGSNISYWKIYDAILYQGKLYSLVQDRFNSNFLITCNYQLKVEAKVSIPHTFFRFHYHLHLLAKSLNDDCLLVGDSNFVSYFDEKPIAEFDIRTKEFREVNDMGGCALFLGPNHFLAKAASSETWFKANCIYFVGRDRGYYSVYDLKTRNFATVPCQFFSNDEDSNYYRRLWVNLDV